MVKTTQIIFSVIDGSPPDVLKPRYILVVGFFPQWPLALAAHGMESRAAGGRGLAAPSAQI